VCGGIAALAFLVPRLVPNREGGFASAATAVLVFLGMGLMAAAVSVYLLVVTIQAYRDLSFMPRLAGIAPSVVLVTALVLLIVFLQY
jgi:hypothetical protein